MALFPGQSPETGPLLALLRALHHLVWLVEGAFRKVCASLNIQAQLVLVTLQEPVLPYALQEPDQSFPFHPSEN